MNLEPRWSGASRWSGAAGRCGARGWLWACLVVALLVAGCANGAKSARDEPAAQPPAAGDRDLAPRGPPPSVELAPDSKRDAEFIERDAGLAEGGVAAPAEADPAAPTVARAELDAFLRRGPAYALQAVRVDPFRAQGRFVGFEIVAMTRSAEQVVSPQLQKGDVITHINGVRLVKPDDYLNAWKLMDEVDAIRVDFVRDGRKQHVVWRVEGAEPK